MPFDGQPCSAQHAPGSLIADLAHGVALAGLPLDAARQTQESPSPGAHATPPPVLPELLLLLVVDPELEEVELELPEPLLDEDAVPLELLEPDAPPSGPPGAGPETSLELHAAPRMTKIEAKTAFIRPSSSNERGPKVKTHRA